jgi:hypothetical protein
LIKVTTPLWRHFTSTLIMADSKHLNAQIMLIKCGTLYPLLDTGVPALSWPGGLSGQCHHCGNGLVTGLWPEPTSHCHAPLYSMARSVWMGCPSLGLVVPLPTFRKQLSLSGFLPH